MTFQTQTAPTEITLPAIKPAIGRIATIFRALAQIHEALPMSRRQRQDIGVGAAEYDPRNEVADLVVRSGLHF